MKIPSISTIKPRTVEDSPVQLRTVELKQLSPVQILLRMKIPSLITIKTRTVEVNPVQTLPSTVQLIKGKSIAARSE